MLKFEKITDDIYLLKIPFSIVWTGVILVCGEKNFLIDSGSEEPEKYIIPALNDLGMSISDIDYLLNTHCHGDHISGHHTLVNKFGIKTAVIDKAYDILKNPADNAVRIRTKFPEYSPAPQSWLKGVEADVILKDGDIFENRLKVIYTPGHDMDCVCWYDTVTKTLITGDSVQANGTPTQGIGFYQSLDSYRSSLEKLKDLDVENIIFGHEYDGAGDIVTGRENVKKCFDYCRELTYVYQKEVEKCLEDGISKDSEIAMEIINKIGCGMPEKLFLALYTVNEHLKKVRRIKNG